MRLVNFKKTHTKYYTYYKIRSSCAKLNICVFIEFVYNSTRTSLKKNYYSSL